MKCVEVQNGEEAEIVLFVLIPQCKECRDRIERALLNMGCFERVEVGYPRREGSPVSLIYDPEKHPDVDFWKKALRAKEWLDAMGYRVL